MGSSPILRSRKTARNKRASGLVRFFNSAKTKKLLPLVITVCTFALIGGSYAAYNAFAQSVRFDECGIYADTLGKESAYAKVNITMSNGTGYAYTDTIYADEAGSFAYFADGVKSRFEAKVDIYNRLDPNEYERAVSGDYEATPYTVLGVVGPCTGGKGAGLDTSSGAVNNTGSDCHNYVLRKDPNNYAQCVAHLQSELNSLGYNVGTVDGLFGNNTEIRVKEFQANSGLVVDGIVGPNTWSKIHPPVSTIPDPSPVVINDPITSSPGSTDAPIGNIDISTCEGDIPHVRGWAFDPSRSSQDVILHIYVGKEGPFETRTGIPRTDITSQVSGIDGNPGFDWAVAEKFRDGKDYAFDVTAFGINSSGLQNGVNSSLGSGSFGPCKTVSSNNSTNTPISTNISNTGTSINTRVFTGSTGSVTNTTTVTSSNGSSGTVGTIDSDNNIAASLAAIRQSTRDFTPASPAKTIKGAGSGRCFDIPNSRNRDGIQTQIYNCNNTIAQKWIFVPDGTIRNIYGKCLDVEGGSSDNGTRVQTLRCNGTSAQKWQLQSDGTLRTATGKCLDVASRSVSNRAKTQIWDCHGDLNQLWNIL